MSRGQFKGHHICKNYVCCTGCQNDARLRELDLLEYCEGSLTETQIERLETLRNNKSQHAAKQLLKDRKARGASLTAPVQKKKKWEDYYELYLEFVSESGKTDCSGQKEGSKYFPLNNWASKNKNRKATMKKEHVRMLNDVGFDWTPKSPRYEIDAMIDLVETMYVAHQKDEKKAHMEFYIAVNYKTKDGICLGNWLSSISTQKAKKNKLSSDQKNRLESMVGPLTPKKAGCRYDGTTKKA